MNEELDELRALLDALENGTGADALADSMTSGIAALSDGPSAGGLRQRMLNATESVHRFEGIEASIAEATDLEQSVVEELLLAIDRDESWEAAPMPNVALLHFEGGPRTKDAITGFVRVAPGGAFPEHGHAGDEVVIVLQGEAQDTSTGRRYGRGELIASNEDVEHAMVVTSDIPLIYLAVAQKGIILGGELITPDDPRA